MSDVDKNLSNDFLLAEYKHVCTELIEFQNRYSRLETITISGFVLIYGYILDADHHISKIVWWVIPLILCIPAGRCIAYYLMIIKRISPYIKQMEIIAYNGKLDGYQNYMRKDDLPELNFALNVLAWLLIIVMSVVIAIWKQFYGGSLG